MHGATQTMARESSPKAAPTTAYPIVAAFENTQIDVLPPRKVPIGLPCDDAGKVSPGSHPEAPNPQLQVR